MYPMVSVILTTFNSKERLRFALMSYQSQTYPKDRFEVIIVDDASKDRTKQWVERQPWHFKVRYVLNDTNKGRAEARNVGIQAAEADIIFFSDSDMIVENNFIKQHVAYHLESNDVVVCGSFWNSVYSHIYIESDKRFFRKLDKLINRNSELKRRAASALTRLNHKGYAKLLKEKEATDITKSGLVSCDSNISNYFKPYIDDNYYFAWIFFVIMNASVRKTHLEKIGFFDNSFVGYGAEDTDVGYRLWKQGLRFIIDPTLKNYHQEHPRNLEKQEAERKSNTLYLVKKHKTSDMALYFYVPWEDNIEKSNFLFKRDHLLAESLISGKFTQQLDYLIWRNAHARFPYFKDVIDALGPFNEKAFESELNYLRNMQDAGPFVRSIQFLYDIVDKRIETNDS